MTHEVETPEHAQRRRALIPGEVDFTTMYIAHDAFSRDIARLQSAADRGGTLSCAAIATWRMFSRQLHAHHTAEDTGLWPRLREAARGPGEMRILAQWGEFGRHVRRQVGGLRGAGAYLGWVLDGANPRYAAQLLGMLPAPARLAYRKVWEPRYRHSAGLR